MGAILRGQGRVAGERGTPAGLPREQRVAQQGGGGTAATSRPLLSPVQSDRGTAVIGRWRELGEGEPEEGVPEDGGVGGGGGGRRRRSRRRPSCKNAHKVRRPHT